MSRYAEADLADLVIHELTHATLFLKGQDQFNEELASFVGSRGALLWLEASQGRDSPGIRAEREDRIGREAYLSFLKETARASMSCTMVPLRWRTSGPPRRAS
jgi:predicted aminopeptidase